VTAPTAPPAREPATIELDGRGLEAPAPLERVLEALDRVGPGDRLIVKFDRRPAPLYRILERNGYAYEEAPGTDCLFEITIRQRPTP
jgi:TusA-related sulfurtransferase